MGLFGKRTKTKRDDGVKIVKSSSSDGLTEKRKIKYPSGEKAKEKKVYADSGATTKYKSVETGLGSGREVTKVKVATTGFKKKTVSGAGKKVRTKTKGGSTPW
jgi:hypothetical protein